VPGAGVPSLGSQPLLSLPLLPYFLSLSGSAARLAANSFFASTYCRSFDLYASCIQYGALTTNIYPGKIKLCHKAILSFVPPRPPLLPRYGIPRQNSFLNLKSDSINMSLFSHILIWEILLDYYSQIEVNRRPKSGNHHST
jgi:hypothetical protein